MVTTGARRAPWEGGRVTVTNPWLAGPAPTRPLERDRLEERILNLLSSQNMCVLATTGPDGPLATPVRYFHLGFTLVFTAAGGSPKLRNLAGRPPGRRRRLRAAGRPGQQPRRAAVRHGPDADRRRPGVRRAPGRSSAGSPTRSSAPGPWTTAPRPVGRCPPGGSSTPSTGCAGRATRRGSSGGQPSQPTTERPRRRRGHPALCAALKRPTASRSPTR